MLNITKHQRNGNQNHKKISPHTHQNGYHQIKISENTNVGKGVEKRKHLYFNWWESKFVQSLRKISCKFLKKLKIGLSCDPAILLLGKYKKKMNTNLKRYMNLNAYYSHIYNRKDMEATSEQDTHGSCLLSTRMG